MIRLLIKIIPILILFLYLPARLYALPQDLEVFIDFEDISGEGTIFIGQEPNYVTLFGFTVETLEDPALLHSGTKAITLGPGQEGRIISSRGIQFLEFYAGESTGGGKMEIRGELQPTLGLDDVPINVVIGEGGVIEGFPTNISPSANPPLYSYVSDSGFFQDTDDFDFLSGMQEVKFFNVAGKFVLDDLGFTLTELPSNNTVFENFDDIGVGTESLVLGTSPNTASFDGGRVIVRFSGNLVYVRSYRHSYGVFNGEEATITFETPAYEIDLFGATTVAAGSTDPNGAIEVYDTNDNLLATFTDLEGSIQAEFKPAFITINADELGAPGGISRLVLKDDPDVSVNFSRTTVDDFGFTPIGVPGTGPGGPPPVDAPSITTQPASQEVQSGASASLSVAASGDDLAYQWYTGSSGDTAAPVADATGSTLTTGALTASTNYWVQVTNTGGTADSDTAVITVSAPSIPLVLDGS